MSLLCDCHFDSEFAYYNDEKIHISDYLKNKSNYEDKLLCENGNELHKYESETRKCHFQHKFHQHIENNKIIEWHKK